MLGRNHDLSSWAEVDSSGWAEQRIGIPAKGVVEHAEFDPSTERAIGSSCNKPSMTKMVERWLVGMQASRRWVFKVYASLPRLCRLDLGKVVTRGGRRVGRYVRRAKVYSSETGVKGVT